jgi:hypothetical protein
MVNLPGICDIGYEWSGFRLTIIRLELKIPSIFHYSTYLYARCINFFLSASTLRSTFNASRLKSLKNCYTPTSFVTIWNFSLRHYSTTTPSFVMPFGGGKIFHRVLNEMTRTSPKNACCLLSRDRIYTQHTTPTNRLTTNTRSICIHKRRHFDLNKIKSQRRNNNCWK